ncbi:MAG: riboflavin synthase [bacterium]
MFTGIIEGMGRVVSLVPRHDGANLSVSLPFPEGSLTVGQSLAINGVCLTMTGGDGEGGDFFLSRTTLAGTNLGSVRCGDRVNMERPLRFNQYLGGHLVTGHVDATAIIREIHGRDLRLSLPRELTAYVVPKGSIALDGISLTVASVEGNSFRVTIIPHTWEHTTLKTRRPGDRMNAEADIIAKHVERLLHHKGDNPGKATKEGVSREKLVLSGFIVEDYKGEI